MEGILTIIQSLTKTDRAQIPKILNSLEEHQAFSHKATNELTITIQLIYDLLDNFSTKHEGLLLLSAFLSQCPLDILEQKGSLWITLCTKICAQRKPAESVDLAYKVLSEILKKSVNVPDLIKSISNGLLSKSIETIQNAPPTAFFAALKFLEMAMLTYPGPCGSSKTIIQKFVCSFVDSIDKSLVTQSGKCMQLLQQVRGGGTHGINQKQAWEKLQTQLVNTLHGCLNAIFSNTVEITDGVDEKDCLSMPELDLSDEPVTRYSQLETRFVNLCNLLRVVLIEPFPVAKSIHPTRILGLISRGLAVNCSTLSKNLIVDNIVVGTLLPKIHVALLELLNSLILVLRSHMLLYGKGVCQLINQSLKWTASGKPNGFKRLFITIRRATYHALDSWCKIAKYGSGVETIADDLVQQILQDITPHQSEVTLKVLSGSKKHLSKKARQKLLKAQTDATNLAQTHSTSFNPQNTKLILSDEGNEQLCASALKCLSNILSSNGCFLKPVTHKILQENIVSLALAVIESSSLKSNLYASADCRAQLYSALHSLIVSSHYLCPPPAQYAATIFSLAQVRDSNWKVRNECNIYMQSIEKILHPQKETLYYPPDLDDIRAALKKTEGDSMNVNVESGEENDDDEHMEVVVNEVIISKTPKIVKNLKNIPQSQSTPNTLKDPVTVEIDSENDEGLLTAPPRKPLKGNVEVVDSSSEQSDVVEINEISEDSDLIIEDKQDKETLSKIEKSTEISRTSKQPLEIIEEIENISPKSIEKHTDDDSSGSSPKKRKISDTKDNDKDDKNKTDVELVEELMADFSGELNATISK